MKELLTGLILIASINAFADVKGIELYSYKNPDLALSELDKDSLIEAILSDDGREVLICYKDSKLDPNTEDSVDNFIKTIERAGIKIYDRGSNLMTKFKSWNNEGRYIPLATPQGDYSGHAFIVECPKSLVK